MRLSDLHPKWWNPIPMGDGIAFGLEFLCPVTKKRSHWIAFDIPINPYPDFAQEALKIFKKEISEKGIPTWHREGDRFENLTISPSISPQHKGSIPCCHLSIINGEIIP